jgi:hypothetical protein
MMIGGRSEHIRQMRLERYSLGEDIATQTIGESREGGGGMEERRR